MNTVDDMDLMVQRALASLRSKAKPKPKPKRKPVKRAGYRESVEWIALNDDEDIGEDGGYLVTINLVADQFGKEPEKVAADVLAYREKHP